MAEKVWGLSPTENLLNVYGQNIEAGCVFDLKGEDSIHLAFSIFMKLILNYRPTETTTLLYDANAKTVLFAAESSSVEPELFDLASIFAFVKEQMKNEEDKTFLIVLNGIEETPEICSALQELLEHGRNVSICVVHNPSIEPSYSEVLLKSFQTQINTEYFKLREYLN